MYLNKYLHRRNVVSKDFGEDKQCHHGSIRIIAISQMSYKLIWLLVSWSTMLWTYDSWSMCHATISFLFWVKMSEAIVPQFTNCSNFTTLTIIQVKLNLTVNWSNMLICRSMVINFIFSMLDLWLRKKFKKNASYLMDYKKSDWWWRHHL